MLDSPTSPDDSVNEDGHPSVPPKIEVAERGCVDETGDHEGARSFGESPLRTPDLPVQTTGTSDRIWSVALVLAVSIFAGIVTATVCTAALVVFQEGWAGLSQEGKVQGVSRTRIGFLTLSIVPQLAMVTAPLAAAWLSPKPLRDRLGLRIPEWPLAMIVVGALATPMVGVLSAAFFGMFLNDSENLKQISAVFRDLGSGPFAIAIAAVIGLTPGFCEEILFRGYAQTRLIGRFGPGIGLLVASLLFAAFHIDPVHAISVFPLGLYLGFLALRSGSIWPSIAGHTLNNALAVGLILTSPADPKDPPTAGAMILATSVFFIGGPACLYMLYWTARQRVQTLAERT